MYPPSLPATTAGSEFAVWTSLRKLPDPWRIFHHVEWQGQRSGRPGDGEADFVLLHPEVGLIVLEVKGGGIAVGDKQWFSFDRFGKRHEIADPFEQAKTSKYTLVDHIRNAIVDLPFLPAGHAVVFPDLSPGSALGANAPIDLMISRKDLTDPKAFVERISQHWELRAEIDPMIVSAISDVLAPTTQIRRTVKDEVVEVNAQIEFWTNEQLGALDALRRNDRQIIYGTAGSGKTVLAKEKAQRLATEGKRVLLTCYNQPLAHSIADDMRTVEGVQVYSFLAFCRREAGVAGMSFPENPDQAWWDEGAPNLLVDSAERTGFHVDAVIVDEGQDFAPSWWAALDLLLDQPGKGEFYMFADTHQAIYRRDWMPPFPGPSYELRKNCRNTLPIAIRVAGVFGDTPSSLVATGTEPEFIEAANKEGAVRALRGLFHRLLNDGKIDRRQVVVLCQSRQDADNLAQLQFAGHPLGRADRWGEVVLVETIHRFKGLEADIAIVIFNDLRQDWDRALAYIGMSRARAQLFVVAPVAMKEAFGWR